MKKIKFIILSNLLILFIAVIFAFSDEVKNNSPAISPNVSAASDTQSQEQPAAPVVSTPDNMYSYNPLGKADPFRPFVEVELAAKKKEELDKKETDSIFPLQRVEVGKFRVVGIAGDEIRRVAIVEDAAKKFYPLFIGTRIGVHNGLVKDILADRVIVDEIEAKKAKRIILKLRKN